MQCVSIVISYNRYFLTLLKHLPLSDDEYELIIRTSNVFSGIQFHPLISPSKELPQFLLMYINTAWPPRELV